MLVQLGDFICRYSNCNRIHAEQLMSNDAELQRELQTTLSDHMKIFLKFQPCHFSSGNALRFPEGYLFNGQADSRSCTVIVIEFYRTFLKPLHKKLTIFVAGLYKAFWEYSVRDDDKATVENSIEGCRLIQEEGIVLRGMRPRDWLFLVEQTTGVDPTRLFTKNRFLMDAGTQRFLTLLKKKRKTGGNPNGVPKKRKLDVEEKK